MRTADELIVRPTDTVRDALRKLNETARNVVLLVDADGRLSRTVTDGDLRRLLLAGWALDARLDVLPRSTPYTAPLGITDAQALDVLNSMQIDQLPLVDTDGRPVGVLLRRDLDRRILLSTPHLSDYERIYVEEAFRTNWIAPLGPNVDAFEREFAEYVGVSHAAALNSGTAAIHLALRLLGVGPGDIVLCSTLTFVASVNPVLYQGAEPVLIDSEPKTWNMSLVALERALDKYCKSNRKPKAVVLVHLYGQSADLKPILDLCESYGVPLLEDAAESLGATYAGRMTGTFGAIGAYSFNGNKIITTSGGGMLVSSDGDLVARARKLSTQAREPIAHYEHIEVGYNYRMSNVLAGIGRGQLRVIEERVAARRRVFERYRQALGHLHEIRWMPELSETRPTRWLSACVLDPLCTQLSPRTLIQQLAARGIEARPLWKPMHRQPLFASCDYLPHAPDSSISDQLFDHGLCLPSGSNLTEHEQNLIIEAINDAVANMRKQW